MRFKISLEISQAMVGKRERIIITERGKEGTSIGRTSSYKPVVVRGHIRGIDHGGGDHKGRCHPPVR